VDSNYSMWWKLRDEEMGLITIEGVVVKDEDTSFGQYGIILDSGTDIIVLPTVVVEAIEAKVD
jgi:hypothetical protein